MTRLPSSSVCRGTRVCQPTPKVENGKQTQVIDFGNKMPRALRTSSLWSLNALDGFTPMGGLDRSASLASASRLIHELCDGRHRISRSMVVGQTLRRRFIITPPLQSTLDPGEAAVTALATGVDIGRKNPAAPLRHAGTNIAVPQAVSTSPVTRIISDQAGRKCLNLKGYFP